MNPGWIEPTDPLHFLTSRLLQSVGKEATDVRTKAVPDAVEVGGRARLCVHHLGRHVGQAARVGHRLRVVRPDLEDVVPPGERVKGRRRREFCLFWQFLLLVEPEADPEGLSSPGALSITISIISTSVCRQDYRHNITLLIKCTWTLLPS